MLRVTTENEMLDYPDRLRTADVTPAQLAEELREWGQRVCADLTGTADARETFLAIDIKHLRAVLHEIERRDYLRVR